MAIEMWNILMKILVEPKNRQQRDFDNWDRMRRGENCRLMVVKVYEGNSVLLKQHER